tara:strand:- start:193 stop:612 length:420 start_codon:yes stop_codon:yes gene_type:complete
MRDDEKLMQIHCPHCDGIVELADNANGLFECPHCEGEFEWKDNSLTELYDFFFNKFFWLGFLAPLLVSILFLILTSIIVNPEGLDQLGYFFIAVLLCPLAAIVLIIYGQIRGESSIAKGAASILGLVLMVGFILILIDS